jgi:hypothetical protein
MGKKAYVLFLLSLILVLSSFTITWAAPIESPSELVVVRASDNSLWKATCTGDPQTCTGFTSFPGQFASTPTVVWDGKLRKYMIWGRATDGSIWKASFTKDGSFNNDWVVVPGNTPSQIGAAGSNLSYPYNNWIEKGSVDVSTLSSNTNSKTNLGVTAVTAPSHGYINVFASGIFAATSGWVQVCISTTSGGSTCDGLYYTLESGESKFTLHAVIPVEGNTITNVYLKANKSGGAAGILYWDDVIAIFTK